MNKVLNLISKLLKSTITTLYNKHKVIKQCIATSLCLIMVAILVPTNVFANENINNNEIDMYAQNVTENVNIEGVEYVYKLYYNSEGNRAISVTDKTKSITNVLTYNEKSSTIYLDNEKLGKVETVLENDPQLENTFREPRLSWQLQGTYHNKISWSKGTTTAIVAGAIAIYLATLGPAGVIAAIGAGSVAILASNAIGGTLHRTLYRATTGTLQHYKYNWSFVASTGERYGTYTYQYTV